MLILKNGNIMSMEQPLFKGDVAINDGKIVALGPELEFAESETIDLNGKYVLPGLVDAHSHIGMWEDGIGDEGADGNEYSDSVTPEMRAIDGINPFDPCFAEAIRCGVTCAVTGPGSANVLGGQFVALKLYGKSVEDMIIKEPIAMKAALGENPKRIYTEQKEAPYTRMAIAALIRKTLVEAQNYYEKLEQGKEDADKLPERDLKLEALLPVLKRELVLKVHAHRSDDILTALRLAKEFNLKITIEHCTEGHLITDVLKKRLLEQDAGIIIGPLISDRGKVELRNLSLSTPRLLYEAGIPFAIMTDHPCVPEQHLIVCAALAAREGLPEAEALKAITINAARIVGLSDSIGSIAPGKDADLAIFDGYPLDFRTRCVMTFINGNKVYETA